MLLLLTSLTAAASAGPINYALIIGSQAPGPGQAPLRYALDDAERVRDVFIELGGLSEERLVFLDNPDADVVREALLTLAEVMDDDDGLLFYYSGHARSTALELGGDPLPLTELEDLIEAVPSALRLVVLDACQAGAMSQVKGASPAETFSVASVSGLDTAGTAVIASSTATELSQESEQLQGSYFTHHLVVGLRGAADVDLSGTVTLSEAYSYAYNRTLVSTSATAVGRQHPTLETELRGQGELVLTRPHGATARLRFNEGDDGDILLVRAESGVVAAEVSKSEGDAVVLGLPPGDYEVLHSSEGVTERCELTLQTGHVQDYAPTRCEPLPSEVVAAKGAGLPGSELETWAVELGANLSFAGDDPYTQRLDDFGFDTPLFSFVRPGLTGSLAWSPAKNVALVGTLATLEHSEWSRPSQLDDGSYTHDRFEWASYRLGVMARGQLPLGPTGWFVPYVQAGGGVGYGRTTWSDSGGELIERHLGWHLGAGAGAQLVPSWRGRRRVGLYLQGETLTAPIIDNLLGDTRDSGAFTFTLGLRASR